MPTYYDPKAHQTEIGRMIESLIKSIPGAEYILPDPYDPATYLAPLLGGLIGKAPTTKFAKQYARKVVLRDKEIWQFPGKYSTTPAEGKAVEISKAIRVGKGIKPTEEIMSKIEEAYNAAKSDLGYAHVQDIVDLTGLPKEDIHQSITYLTKVGKASLNIDRWGNAVVFKLGK